MQRNLNNLTSNVYDLVIVGGGIYGACVAWDATLRGLSVALIEKADFGAATSANSLKTIHGGLRYLQSADFKRMRESIRERRTLMQIAPHLVHPLPVVVPTYGHGLKGKEVLSLALAINDLISCDRNRLADPQKHIPQGRTISRSQCLELLPGIPATGLTGGAIFSDAQVYNSERLTLSFLRSAAQAGAQVANYVAATGFLQKSDRITGVQAIDVLTGNAFDIRAKTVVNTAGAWTNKVLGFLKDGDLQPPIQLAKAVNLVTRSLFGDYAVGLSSRQRDRNSTLDKGSRFFFFAPWRGKTIVGTTYQVFEDDPDRLKITDADLDTFLAQINEIYPAAHLTRADILLVHGGLLPRYGIDPKTGEPLLNKQYQITDRSQDRYPGLISVVGVKYTTARDVAEKVVNQVFKSWGQQPPKSASSFTSIYGGNIEKFEEFLQSAIADLNHQLSATTIRRLVYNYGSAYSNVLKYLPQPTDDPGALTPERAVIQAEVRHAVREEMAQKLSDVLLRRTDLATAGYPDAETVQICAETLGTELGWTEARIAQELQEFKAMIPFQQLLTSEQNHESNLASFTL